MNNKITLLGVIIFTSFFALTQARDGFDDEVSSQAVEEGNFIIDPYYGFPNFGKILYSRDVENNREVKGLGPWGLRLEYLIVDNVGMTVDLFHNSFHSKYSETPEFITDEDGFSVANNEAYNYSITMNRLRVQLGVNYHFDLSDPAFDAYLGIAAGTNNRKWEFESDEPNTDFIEQEVPRLLAFSVRLRTGARYYFNDHIGINMELGIGGPLLSAGLSFRL